MTRATIIDCDPGTDDAVALWLALASPDAIDVRLVTVAGGNVGLASTLRNARAVVALSGRRVPVVAGAEQALLGAYPDAADVHGEDGLGGVRLPEGPCAEPGIAADAIRAVLREAPQPVTLVGLGPATNLALALATEPALASRVDEIVLMSGALSEGNIAAAAEFNAYCDPEALAVLLGCGRPITLATLDLTNQALCTPAHVDAMRRRRGACVGAVASIWERVPPSRRSDGRGHEQHDPCAVAWLVEPRLFTHRLARVRVELGPGAGRGRTEIDRPERTGDAPNVTLLETLAADAFFDLLGERIGRLP